MSNPQFAFPESVTTDHQVFLIPIYILVLIYCCFGLAIVCDVYFVPALQKLSSKYNLSPDIAGSTLMALGASVPELFASLIGVFVTEDDIGTGSIIGSSCFNLIAVPAACAFVASSLPCGKITINSFPVLRNLSFYVITVLVLILVIEDNAVEVSEALILLVFFFMYMGLMVYSAQCKKYFNAGNLDDSLSLDINNNSDESSDVGHFDSSESLVTVYDATTIANKGSTNTNTKSLCSSSSTMINFYQKSDSNNYYTVKNNLDEKTPLLFNNNINNNNNNNNNNSFLGSYNKNLVPKSSENFAESQIANMQNYGYHDSSSLNVAQNDDNFAVFVNRNANSFWQPNCSIASTNNISNNDSNIRLIQVVDSSSNIPQLFFSNELPKITNTKNYYPCCDKRNPTFFKNAHHKTNSNGQQHWFDSNWIQIPMLPVTLSMKILSPLKFKSTFWTLWTFLMSVFLIGALTYLSVATVTMFGKTCGIPETVSGMTILSWGTGIPELIASVVLIRRTAQADMALCNTIGSNVIDISFCLSVPWIVKSFMNFFAGQGPWISVKSSALPWSCLTLLITVFLLVVILKTYNWELNAKVGTWLLVVYASFVIVATFLEYYFANTGLSLFIIMS